jgi:hypothetical protein
MANTMFMYDFDAATVWTLFLLGIAALGGNVPTVTRSAA